MEKISKSLAVVLSIVLIFGLSACGKTTDKGGKVNYPKTEEITLKYTRLYDESDVLDEIIKKYQDKHPNVHVVVNKFNLLAEDTVYDYQQDIIKQIADGAGPDIFMISNNWLPYQKNQIAPMPASLMTTDEYAETFPKIVVNDFIDSDKIYAIPYYLDNLILYYNTDIFKEKKVKKPPKTWQEMVNLIPQLTEYGSGKTINRSAVVFGADMDAIPRAAEILANLMMQYGAEMTTPDHTKATFNLPEPNTNPPNFSAAEALDLYTSFADSGKANYTYNDQKNAEGKKYMDIQAFIDGKAAMFIGYSYHIAYIKKMAPSLHFETANLPQLRPENPVVIANYWGETVSKNCKYPDVAWDFIKFVIKGGSFSTYTSATKRVASTKARLEGYTGRQYYEPVALQVDYSKSWYRSNTMKVEEIFSQMINNVLHFNMSSVTAIDTAIRDINALDQ